LEWLARHLGHSIKVHKEFYRLQSNVAEVVKVGKLLLANEKGLSQYSGQTLDEITLSDIEGEEEEAECEEIYPEECMEQGEGEFVIFPMNM
jgi:hypothetical protein